MLRILQRDIPLGGDDSWDDDEVVVVPDDPEIATVPIDAGETLQADPGEGVGVFVEYMGGGEWNVWATCDTEFSGFSCAFDVFVNADGLIVGDDADLEASDFIDKDSRAAQKLAEAAQCDGQAESVRSH